MPSQPAVGRRIAFVGAGQMGMPMVRRLAAAGHDVIVHARRPEARERCEALGLAATPELRGAVTGAEAVVVCVFSDAQLLDAALGTEGFLSGMEVGALLIIHTTGSPAVTTTLAEEGAAREVRVVEAPVSGSALDIDAGRLTVILGGSSEDVDAARPIVGAYGENLFHVGPLGSAQVVKLLNNALFAANLQLVAEVERLAADLDLDWSEATAVFQSSSGASRAMGVVQSMGSVGAVVDASGPFLSKDVNEVVATASRLGLDLGQLEAVNRAGPLRFVDPLGQGRSADVDETT
jgi:3-hydroxyisobutyrate dehydrogenase-like beta-hydroxyacid dehydrogenase